MKHDLTWKPRDGGGDGGDDGDYFERFPSVDVAHAEIFEADLDRKRKLF